MSAHVMGDAMLNYLYAIIALGATALLVMKFADQVQIEEWFGYVMGTLVLVLIATMVVVCALMVSHL